ncbi:MAG: hypothetical protein V4490_07585 [Pseudomonadota bacterium]
MSIKFKIRKLLREHYGKVETYLEHAYEDTLTENLIRGDIEKKKAWITYNQVILELKYSLKDMLKVKELQYKLTETTNPNEVCIQVIEDVKDRSPELERLYYKITNF